MRAVLQRVVSACVQLPERERAGREPLAVEAGGAAIIGDEGSPVRGLRDSAIDRGLLVYLGIGKRDTEAHIMPLLEKILHCRIFEGDTGRFDKSVLDSGGELLVVSQFTLFGDISRGRRPSFDAAMPPAEAERLYDLFVQRARERIRVATGVFGAYMHVTYTNDGPVTLVLDSERGSAGGKRSNRRATGESR